MLCRIKQISGMQSSWAIDISMDAARAHWPVPPDCAMRATDGKACPHDMMEQDGHAGILMLHIYANGLTCNIIIVRGAIELRCPVSFLIARSCPEILLHRAEYL